MQSEQLLEQGPGGSGHVVLVVDDDEDVRAITAEILASEGFRVLEADGGDQALAIVRRLEGRVDLVLTDVRMPGMDGVALTRALGASFPEIPCVYMSGYAGDALARDGVAADARVLAKPFSVSDLVDRVREELRPHDTVH